MSSGLILRRAACVLLGLPVLLLVVVAGRLAWGPIALDFLRPSLERALGAADGSYIVRLGSTELAWDGVDREPQLRVHDVRVTGQSGSAVATVQTVVLRFAVRALLRGTIAPAEVELLDPRLVVARHPDGTLDVGIAAAEGEEHQRVDVPAILHRLAGTGPGGTSRSALRALSARGATIEITDQGSGRAWRLAGATLVVRAEGTGLVGSLDGRLLAGGRTMPVRAVTHYRPEREHGTITLRFRGFDPGIVAPVGLNVPLDGTIVGEVDAALRPIVVRGHVRGRAGWLAFPVLATESIGVSGLRCRGRFDARARRLQIERSTLALGVSRIHLAGVVAWDDAGPVTVDTRLSGEQLPLETLERWWPAKLAAPVRRWVAEHVRGGIIRGADLTLQGVIGTADRVAVRPIGGAIAFEDIAVRYDDRFPPVTDVVGTARLDQGVWTLRSKRGRVGAIEVIGASVAIPADADTKPRAQLVLALRGPIAEALGLLDREPFGYARALGIFPADVSGATTAHLAIGVPLGASRRGLRTTLTGSARLTAVGVPRVFGGPSLSDGDIALELDEKRLHASGTARLAGAPISVVWDEDLTAAAGAGRRVTVSGRLDSTNRAALGFDPGPWLEGPLDAEVKLVAAPDGSGSVDLHARLDDATIDPGLPRLKKLPGVAGTADAKLTLVRNVVTRVERFTFQAGPSSMVGSATRAADGAGWGSARLQATVAGHASGARDGRCTLTVQQERTGHSFRLHSDDAGALFDAIVGDDRLDGGRLVLAGTAQTTDGSLVLDATLDAQGAVLQRSPVLARIATLASLGGIRSALEGRGVLFDRVGATLRYREPALMIRDGLASGRSLAVAVDGTVDRRDGTADLHGTAVPSYYGLNTAPGRIPLIGEVVGGTGEAVGVQAFDFTVTGSLADPRVQVSPGSAIAPGVLRDALRKLRR
jgi:hypothetical protein